MKINRIKSLAFRTALITLLTITFVAPNTHAQSRCGSLHREGERTEFNNNSLRENHFNTNRNFKDYIRHFPFKTSGTLKDEVDHLAEGSVWIDMGAGSALALVEGLKSNPRIAEGVAISYKRPNYFLHSSNLPGRYRYLHGDFVENMARDGKLADLQNRVDLITDVVGPFSYSEQLPPLLQTYIDLLRPNGTAMLTLMSERSFDGTGRPLNKPMDLNLLVREGKAEKDGLISWLRTITGIEVTEVTEFTVTNTANAELWEKSYAIKIRKLRSNVAVPSNLRTASYEDSPPPRRTFELIAP